MRLLHTADLQMKEFMEGGPNFPKYAILSHTWGKEEVTYQDLVGSWQPVSKAGFSKIRSSCTQAKKDGHDYIWIDTCCIDKSSSAELSEAINSMYRWYKEAAVCYTYLSDVPPIEEESEQMVHTWVDIAGTYRLEPLNVLFGVLEPTWDEK
jgi:hypothetical protein